MNLGTEGLRVEANIYWVLMEGLGVQHMGLNQNRTSNTKDW